MTRDNSPARVGCRHQLITLLNVMDAKCFLNVPCTSVARVMADELTNARAVLQRQTRDAQSAIQDLLSEREDFSTDMMLTHR